MHLFTRSSLIYSSCHFLAKIAFLEFIMKFSFLGMNNREVIEQVERGYRMAQPSTITYPESKTLPSEVKIAQANVYKVSRI